MYYFSSSLMKNIFLIIAVTLFVFGSQSCKKPPLPIIDDTTKDTTGTGGGTGGGEVKVSPYVGTWNYTKIDLKNGILNVMGNDVGTFTGKGTDIVGKVVITEKPNRYSTEVAFTANIDAVLGGQSQAQTAPVNKQTSAGTWVETNGKITLTDDSGKAIAVLSSTSSQIIFSGSFTTQIPVQFFTIDATSDVEFTINK
jgi:hypothetical protein